MEIVKRKHRLINFSMSSNSQNMIITKTKKENLNENQSLNLKNLERRIIN